MYWLALVVLLQRVRVAIVCHRPFPQALKALCLARLGAEGEALELCDAVMVSDATIARAKLSSASLFHGTLLL